MGSGVETTRLKSSATKLLIIQAAEKLFAGKGVDNVTLIEIGQAAGQKNRRAAQYHFEDKQNLLAEIMHRHLLVIDYERNNMIDEMELSDNIAPRDVAKAIVLPLANRLSDKSGGLYYIQIMSQLLGTDHFPHLQKQDLETHFATKRLYGLTTRMSSHLPDVIKFSRTRIILSLLFHSLADFAGNDFSGKKSASDSVPRDVFISDLVDCVELLLTQQPSRHTESMINVAL